MRVICDFFRRTSSRRRAPLGYSETRVLPKANPEADSSNWCITNWRVFYRTPLTDYEASTAAGERSIQVENGGGCSVEPSSGMMSQMSLAILLRAEARSRTPDCPVRTAAAGQSVRGAQSSSSVFQSTAFVQFATTCPHPLSPCGQTFPHNIEGKRRTIARLPVLRRSFRLRRQKPKRG